MKSGLILLAIILMPFSLQAAKKAQINSDSLNEIVWKKGVDVESFWKAYAKSKGGLTWAESETYPEYSKVREGDTFLIKLSQGSCLMEFFHSRWRRANDVRRWDDTINEYAGCPHVFD